MEPKQPKYSKEPRVRHIVEVDPIPQPSMNPYTRAGLYNLVNGTQVSPRFGSGHESNAIFDFCDKHGLPYPEPPIRGPLA